MSHNMQVNDDAAERAARRRSAHFAPMLPDKDRETTPSSAAHKSALAVQKRAKRLSAVAPSNPPVSMEVMNTNFEEWMKLATDNVRYKVNSGHLADTPENHGNQHLELCADRLLPRPDAAAQRRGREHQLPEGVVHAGRVRQDLDVARRLGRDRDGQAAVWPGGRAGGAKRGRGRRGGRAAGARAAACAALRGDARQELRRAAGQKVRPRVHRRPAVQEDVGRL